MVKMDSEYDSDSSGPEYATIDEREAAEQSDSDAELEKAFAQGKLQPGLVDLRKGEVAGPKVYTNNVKGLRNKLVDLILELPWIERMDITTAPAVLAPELSVEIKEHADRRQKVMRNKTKEFNIDEDPLHNDFTREMSFYRQAQAAVLEGYKRLKEHNLPTMRPADYFAEMSKPDDHMQKIRNRLLKKQKGLEISDRVKKIREIKKYGKQVQIEVEQRKVKEKKEMIDKLNKFRKGKIDNIDFLDEKRGRKGDSGRTKAKGKGKKAPFGKNKYTKRNTAADVDNYVPKKKKGGGANKFAPKSGKNKRNMRPGKMRRHTMGNSGNKSKKSKKK